MYEKHKANYHSHTYLCGHANGSPIDYVKKAIETNLTTVGISEHAPMANLRNKNSRLKEEDYQTYHQLLNEASVLANKNEIKFYKGLEIEYFNHIDIYDDYLEDLDYLILGQHYIIRDNKYKSSFRLDDLKDVKLYTKLVIDALNSNYFKMVCHPDLCLVNIENKTDEMYDELRKIIKKAKKLNIPLEVNANGIRKSFYKDNNKELDYKKFNYPNYKFFKMVKEENAKVIITSDAHRVKDLNDWAVLEAYKFAEELKLNVVYELDIKTNK